MAKDWTEQKAIELLENEVKRLRIENIQMQAALGYGITVDDERHIIPTNPFKCGTCDAKSVEIGNLRKANGRFNSYNKELQYDNEQKYAEIQRLAKQVNIAKYGNPDFAWSVYEAKMNELIVENGKMREALQLIIDHPVASSGKWFVGVKEIKGVARAALED